MAAKNDITGHSIQTRDITEQFVNNFEKIDHSIKLETEVTQEQKDYEAEKARFFEQWNLSGEEGERVWEENTTRMSYMYQWGDGVVFNYEKIHARHGYYWHHPCHEYPIPDGRIQEIYAHTDKLLVSHHPDPTKSRGQYMPLLELAVKEDPRCPRNAFYHARELTFYGRWFDALIALSKYLEMPEANWPNERSYAMRLLSDGYAHQQNWWEALKWARLAAAEAPSTREPWVKLSEICYRLNQWQESYFAAKQALAITDKALVYTCDPSCWTEKPYDFAAIAAHHLGLKQEALELGQKALELAPHDERIQGNLRLFQTACL